MAKKGKKAKVGAKKARKPQVKHTAGQRKEILAWVNAFNKKNGKGGQTAAAKKFDVSTRTLMRWAAAKRRR